MCALLNPGAGDVESSSKADNRRASLARTCFMIYIGFLWMQTIHVWYWLRRGWVNPRVTFDGKVRDLEPPRDKWCGPESDSPRLCFFRIRVGVEVQLSRIPANSETAPAGMYRGATPMKPKGSMWSCPGRAACQSRSWPCQETVTQVLPELRCRLGLPIRLGVDRHSQRLSLW